MTTAQINGCPRCLAQYAVRLGYHEPHCITCGWVDHELIPETPPETFLERWRAAKARSEVAELNGGETVRVTPIRTRWRIAGLGAL
jgi:anaerobic ribonucleoside-triphosphate reductase